MPNGRTDIFEVKKENLLIAIRVVNEHQEYRTIVTIWLFATYNYALLC